MEADTQISVAMGGFARPEGSVAMGNVPISGIARDQQRRRNNNSNSRSQRRRNGCEGKRAAATEHERSDGAAV
jgi:hypothetical protein